MAWIRGFKPGLCFLLLLLFYPFSATPGGEFRDELLGCGWRGGGNDLTREGMGVYEGIRETLCCVTPALLCPFPWPLCSWGGGLSRAGYPPSGPKKR